VSSRLLSYPHETISISVSMMSKLIWAPIVMMVFDELGYLENYFIEEQKKGRKMADLYESV
jgi:vacuolar protein sorting-associated protein 35